MEAAWRSYGGNAWLIWADKNFSTVCWKRAGASTSGNGRPRRTQRKPGGHEPLLLLGDRLLVGLIDA